MEYKKLSVDQLQLDFSNPRIARILEMYDPSQISAEQIAMALGAAGGDQEGENYTTFRSLRESIKANGGIIHPIIVNHNSADEYIVIEGNTRVQIYRDFLKKGVEGDWSTIISIVYEDLPQREIDAIRLQSHLVGPRPWQAYSKARYLNQLYNSQYMTLDQIVEFCGGRRKEVQNYIDAFVDMEEYYRPALRKEEGEVFDPQKFSAFVELQRPDRIAAIVQNGFDKSDFARWVIEELIYPLNTVRQLPRVLNNEKAREVFLEDGVREATKLLDQTSETVNLSDADLIDLARAISQLIPQLPWSRIQQLRDPAASEQVQALINAKDLLEDIISECTEDEDA